MKHYKNVDEALCREMEELDKKYAGGADLTMQDLEMIRLIYSSMVKAQTYHAMQEETDWYEEDMERSGRRGSDELMYSGRRHDYPYRGRPYYR